MSFLTCYGDCEGPLGFPMKDAEAKTLDAILAAHPGYEYERAVVQKASADLSPGERADISWIHTEAPDRQKDLVLLSGFDDSVYKANPIVTLNHDYTREPVGRSLWRQKIRQDGMRGVKAKTVYPEKPSEWDGKPWPADAAFALVKAGLMSGKSIGFITLSSRAPTDAEYEKNPEWKKAVWRIVEKWLLVEYCCCWLPVNPGAIVEAVGKATIREDDLRAFGIEVPRESEQRIVFTPLAEIEKSIRRQLAEMDATRAVEQAIREGWDRLRGRV